MSRWLITWLLVAGSLIQTVLKPWGLFGSLEMPVLTGLIVCISLHTDTTRALYAAGLAGLLHDAFCPAPLGLAIPFFVLLAAGINRVRYEVFGDLMVTYILLGLVAAGVETVYYAAVFSLSGLRPVAFRLLTMRLAGGLLAGAIVVPLVALIVLRLRSLIRVDERRYI